MNTLLEQTENLLRGLSRSEKARLLQWLAADIGDAFPGIDSQADICGGEPCIVRTRIPVWVLVQCRKLGLSDADILSAYPTLHAEDLAEAWAFYRSHRDQIDAEISENESA
jgi:uncharacterized protein (DUF433 family)